MKRLDELCLDAAGCDFMALAKTPKDEIACQRKVLMYPEDGKGACRR